MTNLFAVAQYDLTAVTSGIVDQVQAAVTVVGPIAGGLLALGVGFKVIRRLAKA